MLILHLSDIHFRDPICATDRDPDKPFRTRLVQDARRRAELLGSIDAILVGGDIAFAGKPAEYEAALAWLYELADACGCKRERIYVVPGNHDIDRDIILGSLSVQNAQQAIIRASDREAEVLRQLNHKDTGPVLLKPLGAYNEFASRFLAAVFAPEQMFWKADLPLSDGVLLRVYGLTSTVLSGAHIPDGQNDKPGDLYLAPHQMVIDPVDNVVNVVICHHPPEWMSDSDRIRDDIKHRASIHLFGHKHRQRIDRDPDYVAFSAGAVNPDRHERDWRPGYNIIGISLGGEQGGHPHLHVEAHLLEWQTSPEMFKPIIDVDQDVHLAKVRLRNIRLAPPPVVAPASPIAPNGSVDTENTMGDERARNIVSRFWNLDQSERREISQKLKLIEPHEANLPPPERFGRALRRAGERNLLSALADEIEKRERR